MASDNASHRTQGRRRKPKGPPATIFPPHLPNPVTRYQWDTSSNALAEEKGAEHEAKRQRLTSNTPRNDSARAWAPYDCNNAMGAGPVGSSSEGKDNSEPADLETRSKIAKPPKGSPQTVPNDSGVDKGLRGWVGLVCWRQLSLDEQS